MFFRKMVETYRAELECYDFVEKCMEQDVTIEDLREGESEELYSEMVELMDDYEELVGQPYSQLPLRELELRPFRTGIGAVINRKLGIRQALGIFVGGWLCAFRHFSRFRELGDYVSWEGVYWPEEHPRNWREE